MAQNQTPHTNFNRKLEKTLLSGLLSSSTAIADLSDIYNNIGLRSHHMTTKNGEIYKAMISLWKNGKSIDIIDLADELTKTDIYHQNISDIEIIRIFTEYPALDMQVSWRAKRIKDLYIYRMMITICDEIKTKALRTPNDPSEIISEGVSLFSDIEQETNTSKPSIKGSNALDLFIENYDKMLAGESPPGIHTGFINIDNKIGGLCPPDLIILAARPGMGKTSLAMNFVINAAFKKHKVLIFSLEMSKQQLIERMIASIGRLDSYLVKKGKIPVDQISKTIKKVKPILEYIRIDDTSYISVTHIQAVSRRETPDMIMIDYLQLLKGNDNIENRNIQISEISGHLKQLAKDLNIPVLCLSQLNRDPDSRKNKRPMISDLRDSGSIEQDADVILFIYRDSYYSKNETNIDKSELIIAKNRHGSIGKVYLNFDSKSTLFIDSNNS